jgi:intein-encoded DNA endonuclease-like protein
VRKDIEDKKENIIEQYKSGDGAHIISSQYSCHPDVIKRILKENNIPFRTPSESQKCRKGEIRRKDLWDKQEEIVNLYLSGNNFEKIGKIFNTSGVQIKLILKQNNTL